MSNILILLRAITLAIKFSCPLVIVYLSGAAELGVFYLVVGFLNTIVILSGFELSISVGKIYSISFDSTAENVIFEEFIFTLLRLSSLVSLIVTIIIFLTPSIDNSIKIFAPFLIISETILFETGRFYLNVGEIKYATIREFARSIIFAVSILLSLLSVGDAISTVSLATLLILNIIQIDFECRKWCQIRFATIIHKCVKEESYKCFFKKLSAIIYSCGAYFVSAQIIAAQSTLERLFIDENFGYKCLGIYAFSYSLINSASSVLTVPIVASYRSLYFTNRDISNFKSMLILSGRVIGILTLSSVIIYPLIPYIAKLLNKSEIVPIPEIFIAAAVAGGCSTIITAINPYFASGKRTTVAIAFSIIPLFLYGIYTFIIHSQFTINTSMYFVIFVSIFGLLLKLSYVLYQKI